MSRVSWTARRSLVGLAALCAGLAVVAPPSVSALASASTSPPAGHCAPGSHTLSPPGAVMYPDTGNGGYVSVHTDVYLDDRADTNTLLAGTHVELFDRATQCLSSLSLDFERHALGDPRGGPDLRVTSVDVDGKPAAFRFAQPTYPGDPYGQDDPDPKAHEISQTIPVGGPKHNPLPPACSPELTSGSPALRSSQDGEQCPANKLVITPVRPIADGAPFDVDVHYTGTPGTHQDPDGNREGWFRTAGGSFMATEPVGTEDWMPLNDYPTAKPTYDFYDTTGLGKTAIANGELVSTVTHPASAAFPGGSATWHWHAPMPIASYLALSVIGDYSLTRHDTASGMPYYEAQDRHIPAARRRTNLAVMDRQPGVTRFEETYNGPFPWASDGVVVGIPGTSGDTEEMASMIAFTTGHAGIATLYHENMHQWWGDNVTESGYRMTFFKEGLAEFSQDLMHARQAQLAAVAAGGDGAGGNGGGAFDRALVKRFDNVYSHGGPFWTRAPSNPAPWTLFDGPPTYSRPSITYLALYQILGRSRFIQALHAIQRIYGGSSITERQLEAQLARFLPDQRAACRTRLDQFFTQWFDTSYPAGGGANRPTITGPGLAGGGFYGGACPAP